jgi:transcriptional regulator with XRE-family HTH domain
MITEDKIQFGEIVRKLRKAKKIGQAKFAALADMEPKQILDIEKGRSDIRLSTIIKLITALKVTPNELFSFLLPKEKEDNTKAD